MPQLYQAAEEEHFAPGICGGNGVPLRQSEPLVVERRASRQSRLSSEVLPLTFLEPFFSESRIRVLSHIYCLVNELA